MMTPEKLAERIKAEIFRDIAEGRVPKTVGSFSELHNHVDANCYGGTEELLEQMDASAPDTEEAHAANFRAMCDLMNPAFEIIDVWIRAGGLRGDGTVIPNTSDEATVEANRAAIDRVVQTDRYHHIVAWGKWLGFTPETVRGSVEEAGRDNAPQDAIQKIDGAWLRSVDIRNNSNRIRVECIADEERKRQTKSFSS